MRMSDFRNLVIAYIFNPLIPLETHSKFGRAIYFFLLGIKNSEAVKKLSKELSLSPKKFSNKLFRHGTTVLQKVKDESHL